MAIPATLFKTAGPVVCRGPFAAVLLALATVSPLHAARPGGQPAAASGAPKWHIAETANFRVLCYGRQAPGQAVGPLCEQTRDQLVAQWLPANTPSGWRPKCDIVLHPNDASYLREVGDGGRDTTASALVLRHQGRITGRRIDVRASRPNWPSAALAHELAHVVLADRFATEPLPRWIDEGVAILADAPEKRQRHWRSTQQAIARGAHFRLVELLTLQDYPPPGRWGAFYDQSASLVEYLVEQNGHQSFAEFVELSREHGYETALRRVYRLGVRELERKWHAAVFEPGSTAQFRVSVSVQTDS